MGIAKQLYQLQEVELEIESAEQAMAQVLSQLGESQTVARAKSELALEKKRLEELAHQQHAAEWEVDDLEAKLATAKETLYSGRIKNPKELANLQHEVDGFKARRDQLEEKALELMEQVELKEANIAAENKALKALEDEWQSEQQKLSADIERLKAALADLEHRRQLCSAEIDPEAARFYHQLKAQKGRAVARVEQGTCRGCRISLSSAELQRARGGSLVQCSSCGRILFLD